MERIKQNFKSGPRWLIRFVRRAYIRKENRNEWKKLSAEIRNAPGTKTTKAVLKEMGTFGNRYADVIEEMCGCSISMEKRRKTAPCSASDPIVLCVVKNEIARLPVFMDYYRREVGVKAFAFLDDHSTDGSHEFLLNQPDVSLYASDASYTSMRRVAWLNRMIEAEGLNRWYLIVDADELFDYCGRESKKIDQMIRFLEVHKQSRVRALMVDMFAKDRLFSDELKDNNQIVQVYRRFFPEYHYESQNNIVGGGRFELFRLAGIEANSPCVTKYPLIRVDPYDFLINAHFNYPRERNKPVAPNTVLRHYKFLPTDKEKYDERIRKGNFHQNSIEYKTYRMLENDDVYAAFIANTQEYDGYDSLTAIPVLSDLTCDGESF